MVLVMVQEAVYESKKTLFGKGHFPQDSTGVTCFTWRILEGAVQSMMSALRLNIVVRRTHALRRISSIHNV
jgi:hypothetical protein